MFVLVTNNFFSQKYLFINQETSYEKVEPTRNPNDVYHITESNALSMGVFSITLSKINKRKFSEFTLMPFSVSSTNNTTENSTGYTAVGYSILTMQSHFSYHLSYLLRKDKKVAPYVGLGSKLYGNYQSYHPVIATNFSKEIYGYGLQGFFILGLNSKVSERIFLNIQIPVTLFDYSAVYSYLGNLALTEEQRNNKYDGVQFFPKKYYFRIGIGILLKSKKSEET